MNVDARNGVCADQIGDAECTCVHAATASHMSEKNIVVEHSGLPIDATADLFI